MTPAKFRRRIACRTCTRRAGLAVVAGTLVASSPRAAEPTGLPATAPTAAPPFSLHLTDGKWWLVLPQGQEFFSLGLCCVGMGASREQFDAANPGYAAWRYYRDSNEWATATLRRLREWGFTTVGGWSDYHTLRASAQMDRWFTPVLHLGSTAGAPWWDMWSAKVIDRMDAVARDQILALRDDPRLLGYYSDNELGWWNAALFKMTLEQAPTSGQRQRLLALLRDTYRNEWARLREDFDADGASNWEELEQHGMLFMRPGGKGIHVMRRFLGLMAERYYELAHRIIRKYDQRALILGDRYQSFYYPEVARAAAPFVDAISCNLNASWNDGTFVRFQLDTLHALTGRPVVVSEFYMAAHENRSGNRNSQGVFPAVQTQAERGRAMRRTLLALLRLPYVVGADWFQFHDEPRHGRDDGENYNFGLVDIFDRPYLEVTSVTKSLDCARLRRQPIVPRPNATGGVPPAPKDPFAHWKPMEALKDWDRERGFVLPTSAFPLADLYAAWDRRALYLGVYALDIVEEEYYRDRQVPRTDRMRWVVESPDAAEPLVIRLGTGREPVPSDPAVRVESLSGVNLVVRNIAAVELPARWFGRQRFKAGDVVEFASRLHTHGDAYQVTWGGRFRLVR